MVLSCRHCYEEDERASAASTDQVPQAESFLGSLVYGDSSVLERTLQAVEEGGCIIGVSTWCDECGRASVLSYAYYRHVLEHIDGVPPAEIMSRHEYYTRMCMFAEFLRSVDE